MPKKKGEGKQIFSTVTDEAFSALEQITSRLKVTKRELLESVLAWLSTMSDDELQAIVERDRASLLSEMGNYIHDLAWADHAFSSGDGFASWSIQEYQRLRDKATKDDGILQYANYRLAFSWARKARLLRDDALTLLSSVGKVSQANRTDWHQLYRAADDSLCNSIALNKMVLQQREHPVLRYNLACENSMRAQFYLESRLPEVEVDSDDPVHLAVLKALRVRSKDSKAISLLFEELDSVALPVEVYERVDECIQEAIGQLRRAIHVETDDAVKPWVDMGFIVDFSSEDTDLIALRNHPDFEDVFEQWKADVALSGRLQIYRRLCRNVSRDVSEAKGDLPSLHELVASTRDLP